MKPLGVHVMNTIYTNAVLNVLKYVLNVRQTAHVPIKKVTTSVLTLKLERLQEQ